MKAAQFCVTAFPKLDNEAQLARLREKYDPAQFRVRPHIPIIPPFTPANLDDIQNVIDHVSTARRSLRPLAIAFYKCVERGEYLLGIIEQGREEVMALHTRIAGAQPVPMLQDSPSYEPLLWLFRVPDRVRRGLALAEVNRLGKTIGIVDAVSVVSIEADGEQKLAAVFPFGVGRVDYYDRFPL